MNGNNQMGYQAPPPPPPVTVVASPTVYQGRFDYLNSYGPQIGCMVVGARMVICMVTTGFMFTLSGTIQLAIVSSFNDPFAEDSFGVTSIIGTTLLVFGLCLLVAGAVVGVCAKRKYNEMEQQRRERANNPQPIGAPTPGQHYPSQAYPPNPAYPSYPPNPAYSSDPSQPQNPSYPPNPAYTPSPAYAYGAAGEGQAPYPTQAPMAGPDYPTKGDEKPMHPPAEQFGQGTSASHYENPPPYAL